MKISGKGTMGVEREPEAHQDRAEKALWKLKCFIDPGELVGRVQGNTQ